MAVALSMALALAAVAAPESAAPPTLKALWIRNLVAPDLLEWRPEETGGPAVDPDTGAVVVGARDGRVTSFLPRGEVLWEFKAGGGFACAPLVHDGAVYVGSLDGRLYALELGSGRERWRYDAQEEIGATPLLHQGILFFPTFQDTLFAVDARTGAWKWQVRRERKGEGFTVRGVGRPVLAQQGIVAAGWADGTVTAHDAATGAPRWEQRVAPQGEQMDVDGLAADGGRVFAAAYSGAVVALDAASGKQLWERKLPGASRLLFLDGMLVALGTAVVQGLDPADGAVRWSRAHEGVPSGLPVRFGGRAAFPTGKELLLLDARNGRVRRAIDPGSGVSASPAGAGKRGYVLSNAGAIVAVELQ